MQHLRLATILLLAAALTGCASVHANFIGAPKDPRPGPLPLSAAQLDELSGTDGFKQGVAEAEANILLGKLVFRTYGFAVISYPRPIYDERYDRALAKYGVSFDNEGCEFPAHGLAAGYRHRMAQEVLRRFGDDFWQRIDQEARR